MRIGIISDTHDQIERTTNAVKMLKAEGAEVLFHCGDLVDSEIVFVCAMLPSYYVFGNNDIYYIPQIRSAIKELTDAVCLELGGEVELDGKRIAITHSHLENEVSRLLAPAPDYLLTGHTHVAADRRDGTTRRINPGALHRASSFTVAILDLTEDSLKYLTVPRSPTG